MQVHLLFLPRGLAFIVTLGRAFVIRFWHVLFKAGALCYAIEYRQTRARPQQAKPAAGQKHKGKQGVIPMENNILLQQPWLQWAMQIQSIAQCGLTYVKDPYDAERYEQLRSLAAEMLSYKTELPVETVKELFCNESGYQTPKLDTRAAVFKNGKILLVQEKDGLWALPGGWVDVLESIGSNTIKEVKEEAGLDVKPIKIIALQDKNRHNPPPRPYSICKVFVLCECLGGSFVPNTETLAMDYFSLQELPVLAAEKSNKEQLEMCFKAAESPCWEPMFD